ncbi:MAG: hypothetical protein MEQ84_07705 [Mesorhizobium sp.]|nr:hypothetical protein [Mesorhizobium sp.]
MKRLIAAAGLAALFIFPAHAEVLGRWCSQPEGDYVGMDAAMIIERSGGDGAVARYEFRTSDLERELDAMGPDSFVVAGDVDGYRLLPDGRLEIFDDLGVIRTADPIAPDVSAEECWR